MERRGRAAAHEERGEERKGASRRTRRRVERRAGARRGAQGERRGEEGRAAAHEEERGEERRRGARGRRCGGVCFLELQHRRDRSRALVLSATPPRHSTHGAHSRQKALVFAVT